MTDIPKNWRNEILAYFDHPISNGYTEALNGVAKVINRAGRGYSFELLRARLLFGKEGRNTSLKRCPSCGGLFVSMVTTKLAVGADGLKPISTNETRTICTSCSERFHTEDHPQHDSLTTR